MKQLELKQLIKEAVKESLSESFDKLIKKAVKESLKEGVRSLKGSESKQQINHPQRDKTPIKPLIKEQTISPQNAIQQLMEETRQSMSREDFKNILGGDTTMIDIEGNPVPKDHPTLSLLNKDYSHIL